MAKLLAKLANFGPYEFGPWRLIRDDQKSPGSERVPESDQKGVYADFYRLIVPEGPNSYENLSKNGQFFRDYGLKRVGDWSEIKNLAIFAF